MDIFDLDLPSKDLDRLEDRLRTRVGQLPDEARRHYFDLARSRFRDPDTYVVLCWSLGLGLHHLYLRRWGSFLLDLSFSLILYGGLIAWFLLGTPPFPILMTLAFFYNTIDTLYCLLLSQRIVQHHNIRLGQNLLAVLDPTNHLPSRNAGTGAAPSQSHDERNITRANSRLFLAVLAGLSVLCLGGWLLLGHGIPFLLRQIPVTEPGKILRIDFETTNPH
ncbi:MAG: hypothetical protein HQL76_12420 [Magnetococcales bacterium]|nr:hypothetical protein [Magnetococcales bacterium]